MWEAGGGEKRRGREGVSGAVVESRALGEVASQKSRGWPLKAIRSPTARVRELAVAVLPRQAADLCKICLHPIARSKGVVTSQGKVWLPWCPGR